MYSLLPSHKVSEEALLRLSFVTPVLTQVLVALSSL
jgi:hypothetical protein